MPSNWTVRTRTAVVCLLAVFGLGIAAESGRRYWSTNVGDVSVQRTDTGIALAIDGDVLTNWHMPVTLRAGSHQFHATWQGVQIKTTIHVTRGDPAWLNKIKYSLHNGQLRVKHNSRLLEVVPRPEPEVFAIQTASGNFWHTADNGEIVLRTGREPGAAEPYTIHWLRPDHSEAFIQSSDGRFVTNPRSSSDVPPRCLKLADEYDPPCVFKIERVGAGEWKEFATGEYFVGVDADASRLQTTPYELFASPHLLVNSTGESDSIDPIPPPPELNVPQPASRAPTVRRLKGHTNVIRAVVFTPDGRHIVSGSSDGTIRFWNVRSGQHVNTIRANRAVMSLAISSDGKLLVAGMNDEMVKIWRLQYGSGISHLDEGVLSNAHRDGISGRNSNHVRSIAFSPDNANVAAADNSMRVWNVFAPDERCRSSSIIGSVTSLAWSATGDRIWMCVGQQSVHTWPKRTDNFSRDGRSGKILIRSGVRPLLVIGGDIFDAETQQIVHTFRQRHGVRSVSAQISARRNLLVTADVPYRTKIDVEPDELVSIWDLQTGRPLAVLRERSGQVGNVAFSPDGQHIAYGNGIRETSRYLQEQVTGDYDLRVWTINGDERMVERTSE